LAIKVSRPALLDAARERRGVVGPGLGEEGTFEREVDDLLAQLVGGAERHVGDGEPLQVGDVLLEILQRIADLQRDEPAQAAAVVARRDIGLVEHLDLDVRGLVDQCREADQGLAGLADFHQLGQVAEGPGGVLRCGGLATHAGTCVRRERR
jgi:hypothetical protein